MTKDCVKSRGVYAAVLTPFTSELEPSAELFLSHCRRLLQNGCDGLAPFGTTGEGVSMSVEQKLNLLEALSGDGAPMERVIPGTGVSALGDVVRISRRAAELGCEGVLCVPPFYYKNPSEDGLFAFYSEVIEQVGQASLRLFLYHFPQMSATPITLSLLSRLVERYPHSIAGVKDSSGDWSNAATLIKEFPELHIFSGSEKFLLDNLEAGGAGCISATTNILAQLAQQVFQAWRAGLPEAPNLQAKLSEKRLALQALPLIPALKQVLLWDAPEANWEAMLPPCRPLPAPEKEALRVVVTGFEKNGASFS